ncbi:hypothetical protein C7H84_33545 [Burkholderia sp. Nafp2/4-1b]|nr:hypothetical protein C7H84_33545 [Burkholderia sp. Nafp2/4-1b]
MIELILQAGRGALEVCFYTLLPIMVVMTILLRVLEVTGLLEWTIRGLTPIARPFGLTGLGVLAMFQVSFVSFFAPLPTLALMERRGASDRHLAAAMAGSLSMAPANVLFPMAAMGLDVATTLTIAVVGGLVAASCTYWLFGGRLSNVSESNAGQDREETSRSSLLKIINTSGSEAVHMVLNVIPMLLISIVVVLLLQKIGVTEALENLLAPALTSIGIAPGLVLPSLGKYVGGVSAFLGIAHDAASKGKLEPALISLGSAGFLLHPLDLPGVAVMLSAGPRLAKNAMPGIIGGCIGITVRTLLGIWVG